MPLTRARDNCTVCAGGIRFLMRDGRFEIICQIDVPTLSRFGTATSLAELIAIFQRDRTAIERAASHKYDRTEREDYEIVTVTAADLELTSGHSG
jgi:hypothetical protein